MSSLFSGPPSPPPPPADPVAEQIAKQQADAATAAAQQQAQSDASQRGRAALTNPESGALGVSTTPLGVSSATLF